MELSRIENEAPAAVLRAAWWAWWAVAVSWMIGALRLGAYVLSNFFNGDGDDAPVGVWATLFDAGRIAVGSSTAVALVITGFFLAAAARRWRAIERVVEG